MELRRYITVPDKLSRSFYTLYDNLVPLSQKSEHYGHLFILSSQTRSWLRLRRLGNLLNPLKLNRKFLCVVNFTLL
jgi:hypothetical protein